MGIRVVPAMMIALALLWQGFAAAAVTPQQLQNLHWRSIGPFRGGRVLAVTGVPGEPAHFYFGAVNGGIWETLDAGRTWQPVFDSAPVASIGALALAPSNPQILYAGTGEADMRSDIAQGAGMFKSGDGGHSWQPIGLADTQQIGRILVDPANPDVVLVAALGHPYGPNETRGVFRSADGGKTWQRTLFKDADTGATDLAYEPGNPQVVYAALWQTRRPPWNVYPPSSGPGSGLYKSTDGGISWAPLAGHGLPDHPGRIGIAVAPSQPGRVYALIDAAAGGMYRSDDRGASWVRVDDDSRIWKRAWYFAGIAVEPQNPDVVYVCDTNLYRSTDAGKTFVTIKGAPGGDDYHQLWIDPKEPQRRMLGVDQGAVVSVDGGATWSSWYNQPTGQFYHVITDNRFPYWVYGAQQDSGAAGIPSRSFDIDGINMTQFRETTAGGESDNIAPDPDDPEQVFGGRVDRLDLRTGQTHNVDPTLALQDLYRETWTLPLVFGPRAGQGLFFGNQRIFRTTDHGGHWEAISPDLSRPDPGVPPSLDAPTAADNLHAGPRRGVVYAIGPSPLADRLLWAGTDDGLVWRSTDLGGHWQDVTPPVLTAWSKIGVVEPSHFDTDTAYIAVDRHRLDDFAPYIYRTRDAGKSWTPIAAGIADGGALNAVNVVREDPERRGLLYAGTERGVYVSFDDGDHWQALQQNLPRTSVRDLRVHGDDLVIATHGRSFWIMDDITPLRSWAGLAAEGAEARTQLLPPAVAIRARPTGFAGTPMPKDEPRAANPPDGAILDYYLDAAPGGPVTLSVQDSSGATVRSFSSTDPLHPPDPAKLEIAPEWADTAPALEAGAGAHRFVWSLRYAVPAALAQSDPEAAGVWVPPGAYSVILTVDGKTYRQPLAVAPDPRVHLSADAYTRQFALARDIAAARNRLAEASAAAGKRHEDLLKAADDRTRSGRRKEAEALAAADVRLVQTTDIATAKESQNQSSAPINKVGGMRYLNASLAKLAQAVDGADDAPSTDAMVGYRQLSALLAAQLDAWGVEDRATSTLLGQPQAQQTDKPPVP
jgi:photosystem II stability/assembly factor-like uncharacterized protein